MMIPLQIVGSSFAGFAEAESQKDAGTCDTCCVPEGGTEPEPYDAAKAQTCTRQDTVNDKLTLMANEFINQLEDDGVSVIRPRICRVRNVTTGVPVASSS